jgi:hypothetical protein
MAGKVGDDGLTRLQRKAKLAGQSIQKGMEAVNKAAFGTFLEPFVEPVMPRLDKEDWDAVLMSIGGAQSELEVAIRRLRQNHDVRGADAMLRALHEATKNLSDIAKMKVEHY